MSKLVISQTVGKQLDSHLDIPVFENGFMYHKSHGKSYAPDGYYYGQKWQCIEFVKRFYREALGHEMPNIWGHAKTFFDNRLADATLNVERGLLQFHNGSDTPPQQDDILVFQDTQYGHVGIVTRVTHDKVEIIQQNIYGQPRQLFSLSSTENRYTVKTPRVAAGWLRHPDRM